MRGAERQPAGVSVAADRGRSAKIACSRQSGSGKIIDFGLICDKYIAAIRVELPLSK